MQQWQMNQRAKQEAVKCFSQLIYGHCVLIFYQNCSKYFYLFLMPMICFFSTCSDAVDSLTGLYNHVEEKAHVLVQRSNMSLEHLEYLLQLREMQGHFLQVHYNNWPSDLFR